MSGKQWMHMCLDVRRGLQQLGYTKAHADTHAHAHTQRSVLDIDEHNADALLGLATLHLNSVHVQQVSVSVLLRGWVFFGGGGGCSLGLATLHLNSVHVQRLRAEPAIRMLLCCHRKQRWCKGAPAPAHLPRIWHAHIEP